MVVSEDKHHCARSWRDFEQGYKAPTHILPKTLQRLTENEENGRVLVNGCFD